MEDKVRVFIAIDLPQEVKSHIQQAIEELREIGTKVVWTQLENLHLTLKFLGNTSPEQLDKVKSQLEIIAQEHLPFTLSFQGLGGFPNEKKPRIIWLGVSDGESEIKKLFYRIEQSLISLDIKEEKNEFVPHLTLGRIKIPKTNKVLEEKIKADQSRSFGSFKAVEFKLIKSVLTHKGPVYETLFVFSL